MSPNSRKLQVFVSSTYSDLRAERQAAVEAILKSGHIPAGMELFSAGDQSQLDTIYRWIGDSDVYMLILGGRYGSIEPVSGKSYTEVEYEYASRIGKPRFAVVITEAALDEKVREQGHRSALDLENQTKLTDFRKSVLSRQSSFFSDERDIKLAIYESIKQLEADENLLGWVRDGQATDYEVREQLSRLQVEYSELLGNRTFDSLKIPLPNLPSLNENHDIEISYGAGVEAVRVRGQWLDFFSFFFSCLVIKFSDYNGEEFFSVDDNHSRVKFAIEVENYLRGGLNREGAISQLDFSVLKSFYSEVSLFNDSGVGEPFSPFARKLARRLKVYHATSEVVLEKILGNFPDDEIPF